MAQMTADMHRLSWSIPFVPRLLPISMTYHRVFNMSSPAEATSETGTAYISAAFEFIPGLVCGGFRIDESLMYLS